jgi:hypothetical protein
MDHDLIIAIVAAMMNIVFSLIFPAILSINSINNVVPFSYHIKKHYKYNRDVILISSVFVIIFVYLSLKVSPWVENNVFKSLLEMSK